MFKRFRCPFLLMQIVDNFHKKVFKRFRCPFLIFLKDENCTLKDFQKNIVYYQRICTKKFSKVFRDIFSQHLMRSSILFKNFAHVLHLFLVGQKCHFKVAFPQTLVFFILWSHFEHATYPGGVDVHPVPVTDLYLGLPCHLLKSCIKETSASLLHKCGDY